MSTAITDRQLEVLQRQGMETLCEWYCLLNAWKWPEKLPDDPYRGLPVDERMRVEMANKDPIGKQGPVLFWIEAEVGEKEISRFWNTKHMSGEVRKTEAEFEEWWKVEEEKRRKRASGSR